MLGTRGSGELALNACRVGASRLGSIAQLVAGRLYSWLVVQDATPGQRSLYERLAVVVRSSVYWAERH